MVDAIAILWQDSWINMIVENSNNFAKEILVSRFARTNSTMDIYERELYSAIGYGQYTSEPLSYIRLAEYCKLSISTIKRVIPKLINNKHILKISTNKIVTNNGKSAYRYQLSMKLDGFPSLSKLTKNKETNTLGSLTTNSNNIFNYDNKIHESYDGVLIQLDNLKGIQRQIAQKHNRIIEKEKTNETVIF